VQVAISLGELKLKLKNGGCIKKSFNHLGTLYSSRLVQPYHFQPNLIWSDGTFKASRWGGGGGGGLNQFSSKKASYSLHVDCFILVLIKHREHLSLNNTGE
jgi:hypothetical protein